MYDMYQWVRTRARVSVQARNIQLPVGYQRLPTIYRDVTREPFRLHPSAFPPENFFNSYEVFHLLAQREFA